MYTNSIVAVPISAIMNHSELDIAGFDSVSSTSGSTWAGRTADTG